MVFVLHAGVVAWVEKDGAAAVRVASPNTKFVLCDESGHTNFPFSYLAHVTLLTLAQARLSFCSGFAQTCSP